MRSDPQDQSDEALQRQRHRILVALRRLNLAASGGLLLVVTLAAAAILAALRAESHAHQAAEQRARAEEELWKARLAHARAARASGKAGRRSEALEALKEAAQLHPSREVRDEAIANLALMDLGEEEFFFRLRPGENSPVFDPSMERIALTLTNGSIAITRARDRAVLQNLAIAPGPLWELRWSPDGRFLAGRCPEEARVWEVQSGKLIVQTGGNPDHGCPKGPLSFSGNSRLVAVGANDQVELYDLPSGAFRKKFAPTNEVALVGLHPVEPWVAVARKTEVMLVDLETEAIIKSFEVPILQRRINDIVWSPNGRFLAAACEYGQIYAWDVYSRDPRPMNVEGHDEPAIHVAFHPRSDRLLSHSWGADTRIWGLKWDLWVTSQKGKGLEFSRDGGHLSFSRPDGIGLWRVMTADPVCYTVSEFIRPHLDNAAFSPDGRWMAALDSQWGGLWLWDVRLRRMVSHRPLRQPCWVQFTQDGSTILVFAQEGLLAWPLLVSNDHRPMKCDLGKAEVWGPPLENWTPNSAAMSRDGKSVLTVWENDQEQTRADLIDLKSREAKPFWLDQPGLHSAAFSADGRRLFTSSWAGGGIWVWDVATRQVTDRFAASDARIGVSPDGQWLALARPIEYELKDATTFRTVARLPRDDPSEVLGWMDFSPDGRWFAYLRSRSIVPILEVANRERVATLELPNNREATRVRFSPDSRWLAVYGAEGYIHLWQIASLRRTLAAMGLDWNDSPPTAGAAVGKSARPGVFASGVFYSRLLIWLAVLGMIAGFIFSLFVARRHRELMSGYLQIDNLLAQRNRQLAKAQADLFQNQKMKALGTLAAGIAHNFNNLLSIIRMANKLTGEQAVQNATLQENVALVEKSVAQGKAVVRSMLGYSRSPQESGPYSVVEMVEETLQMLQHQFLGGITLEVELERDLGAAEGVRNRLQQILLNLMVNAVEAMEGRGRLRVVVTSAASAERAWVLKPRAAPRSAIIELSDSGPGMKPEVRERIFEPFFTTKTLGAELGTGLGLSMVYSLAQEEGLGLAVDTAPGKGTTFWVVVPLQEPGGGIEN